MAPRPETRRVVVVVDPKFGERLRNIPQGQPVWIAMSPANEPVVRSLWANSPASDHLTGISSFAYEETVSASDSLIGVLDAIDLHHGPHSSPAPYKTLEVVGTQLNVAI